MLRGSRIAAVGRWRDLSRACRAKHLDLGEVVVLPGLVNAHCHLDYTHMAGQFLPPKLFTDWLKLITTSKGLWNLSEYRAAWEEGAAMLLRTGTTTVADIEAMPELLPGAWQTTPLRVLSFLEMIGITPRRQPQAVLQEAVDKMDSLERPPSPLGLSPHAPYSTVPELLRLSADAARRRRCLVTIHVAESALEFEMFTAGSGGMFTWLQRSGRDMSDCDGRSPVQHLQRSGSLNSNLLAVHANYLAKGDASLLGKEGVSVVHCPRSHYYFRHAPFPLRRLMKAGVNVCLGTDSLATVYKKRHQAVELNMFEEMRALAHNEPSLSPKTILHMATTRSARALGMSGRAGQLSRLALADLIAIPFAGGSGNAYEAVLHHKGHVTASMIGGRWVFPPPTGWRPASDD